ncbi:MAG: hypothetical protein ACXVHC_04350 [Frankiaceae bacterium]
MRLAGGVAATGTGLPVTEREHCDQAELGSNPVHPAIGGAPARMPLVSPAPRRRR